MKTKSIKRTKVIAMFMTVVMLFGIIACAPFTVSAETYNGFKYEKYNEDYVCITGYTGDSSIVNIPLTIDGYNVIGIEDSAFRNDDSIIKVNVPYGIAYIGNSAFYGCSNLKTIKLPKDLLLIGADAFDGTAYANEGSNRELGFLYIDSYLVDVNRNVSDCVIKDGTTVIASRVFQNNTMMKSITFPDSLLVIGNSAFYGCNSYKISDFKLPPNLYYIGEGAFENCWITEAVIPDSVKYIGRSAFRDTELTKLKLPSSIQYILASTFYNCRDLTEVEIPDTVLMIDGSAFSNTGLTKITIPESVEYIGSRAFNGTNLTEINLPNKYIEIYADSFMQTRYSFNEYNWKNDGLYVDDFLLAARFAISELEIKEGTKYIAAELCEGAHNFNNVTIPESVVAIGSRAFLSCTGLHSVEIPASVEYIGEAAFGIEEYAGTYYRYKNFEIVGIPNSTAHQYAKAYGLTFVDGSKATSIKLNRSTLTLGVGEVYTLIKSVNPEIAGSACTWSSSNSSVVSVNSKGTLTAKKTGTATVTVKTSNGLKASCKVTIKSAPSSINVSTKNLTLGVGEEFIIYESTNSGSYAYKFDWSSSNTSVATVTKTSGNKAKIIAKGVGTANITVKTYNGKTATCQVTVKSAPTSVTLSNSNVTLGKGETFIISQCSNSGSYAKNFTWSSSNTSVATIEKTSGNKAKITAKGNGAATITFKTYNGKTATCKVTVKNAPSSVKINKSSITLGSGETYTISESTNSGTYANADNLKWSSSNTNVVTVTKGSGNKAVITAKGNGTATVKITLYNGKTATCNVTVKNAPTSVKLNTSNLTLGVGEEFIISEGTNSGTYANADNLKWNSSNTNVATVTKTSGNKAKIVAKGTGTAKVKITLYNGLTAECTVTVKNAPNTVNLSKTNLTLGKGETYIISQYSESGSYARNFTWSSSNTSVATVEKTSGNKAKITAKENGTATITIKTYNGKTSSCIVNVIPYTESE